MLETFLFGVEMHCKWSEHDFANVATDQLTINSARGTWLIEMGEAT
jgi:hypothetical protein